MRIAHDVKIFLHHVLIYNYSYIKRIQQNISDQKTSMVAIFLFTTFKTTFFELAIMVIKSDNPGSGSNKNLGKKPGSR